MDAIDLSKQEVPRIKVILPDGKTTEEIRLPGIAVAVFRQWLPKVFGKRGLFETVLAVQESEAERKAFEESKRDPRERKSVAEVNEIEMVNSVNAVLARVKPDLVNLLDLPTCEMLFNQFAVFAFGAVEETGPVEKKSCNSPQ